MPCALKAFFWRLVVSLGLCQAFAEYGQVGTVIAGALYARFCGSRSCCAFWALCSLGFMATKSTTSLNYPLVVWITLALLIGEFARSTLFKLGFPWLLPGYAIENTWLFELLPIGWKNDG